MKIKKIFFAIFKIKRIKTFFLSFFYMLVVVILLRSRILCLRTEVKVTIYIYIYRPIYIFSVEKLEPIR